MRRDSGGFSAAPLVAVAMFTAAGAYFVIQTVGVWVEAGGAGYAIYGMALFGIPAAYLLGAAALIAGDAAVGWVLAALFVPLAGLVAMTMFFPCADYCTTDWGATPVVLAAMALVTLGAVVTRTSAWRRGEAFKR